MGSQGQGVNTAPQTKRSQTATDFFYAINFVLKGKKFNTMQSTLYKLYYIPIMHLIIMILFRKPSLMLSFSIDKCHK